MNKPTKELLIISLNGLWIMDVRKTWEKDASEENMKIKKESYFETKSFNFTGRRDLNIST